MESVRAGQAYLLSGVSGLADPVLVSWVDNLKIAVGHLFYLPEPTAEKPTVTIESVRRLNERFSLRPFVTRLGGAPTYLALIEANLLQAPAANALLKLLEEPPSYASLALVTPTADAVWPTLRSRCQIIRLQSEKSATAGTLANAAADALDNINSNLAELLSANLIGRFKIVGALKAEQMAPVVGRWIEQARQLGLRQYLPLLLEAHHDITQTNINRRICLEALMTKL